MIESFESFTIAKRLLLKAKYVTSDPKGDGDSEVSANEEGAFKGRSEAACGMEIDVEAGTDQ